jgi:hypothetical protein
MSRDGRGFGRKIAKGATGKQSSEADAALYAGPTCNHHDRPAPRAAEKGVYAVTGAGTARARRRRWIAISAKRLRRAVTIR